MARRQRQSTRPEQVREREPETDAIPSRGFWTGTLTFGLVSIPVELVPANRAGSGSLRMLGPSGNPLARRYYEPESGKEIAAAAVERGFEVEPGRYVIVSDQELEEIAPEKTRDIELQLFVATTDLDPLFFVRSYVLAPTRGSNRPYRLLASAMDEAKRAGIATFVMRGKEYLVAILAEDGILRAETLRFADEVRTPEGIGLPPVRKPSEIGVRRFARAISRLHADHLDRDELRDEEARRLEALAAKKLARGVDLVEVEPEPRGGEGTASVPDLLEVLRSSLQGSSGRGRSRAPTGGAVSATEATKEELYRRAQALDIEGRSTMTKAELAEAIASQQ